MRDAQPSTGEILTENKKRTYLGIRDIRPNIDGKRVCGLWHLVSRDEDHTSPQKGP